MTQRSSKMTQQPGARAPPLQLRLAVAAVLVHAVLVTVADAFYVPGIVPVAHKKGSVLRVQVNGLHSVTHPLPQSYYDANEFRKSSSRLKDFDEDGRKSPFCLPHNLKRNAPSAGMNTLGMLLSGERLQWSPYTLLMAKNESCNLASCSSASASRPLTAKQVGYLEWLVERKYRVHLLIDNLPAYSHNNSLLRDCAEAQNRQSRGWSTKSISQGTPRARMRQNGRTRGDYSRGFLLGIPKWCLSEAILNNHLHFVIKYHTVSAKESQLYVEEAISGDELRVFRRRRLRRFASVKKKVAKKARSGIDHAVRDPDLQAMTDAVDSEVENIGEEPELLNEGDDLADLEFATIPPSGYGGATVEDTLHYITDISVAPYSIDWTADELGPIECFGAEFNISTYDNSGGLDTLPPLFIRNLTGKAVQWTYSVAWIEDPTTTWDTRWNAFFKTAKAQQSSTVYWISILYSSLIIMALTSTVVFVILRSVQRDLARYNVIIDIPPQDDMLAQPEERGWKQVHGDVFRRPKHTELLIIFVSTGVQILAVGCGILLLGLSGWISPSNRGSLATGLVVGLMIFATLGGCVTAFLSQQIQQRKSWTLIAKFSVFLPGMVFGTLALVNIIFRVTRSSGALPVSAMLALLIQWLFAFVPLTFIGAAAGFRMVVRKNPVKTNTIPRQIDPTLLHPLLEFYSCLLVSGLIPLTTAYLELRFLFAAWWEGEVFYSYGYLSMVFVLWFMSCALVSVSTVYYRLCGENYLWWWISFAAPSSYGLHAFLFIVHYYFVEVKIISFAAALLYFVCMSLAVALYVLCAGAIGMISAWLFVRVIYSAVKID